MFPDRFGLYSASSDFCFFFQAEDGIRDVAVTGVQTCALPISFPHALLDAAPQARRGGDGHGRAHLRLGGGRGRRGARGRTRPGDRCRRDRRPRRSTVQRPPLARLPRAARPRGGAVPAGARARDPGDRRRRIGRHGGRIGSGTALPPQGRTPRGRGRRAAGGSEHVGLARSRRPLVLGGGEPPRTARVRRLPYAAPPDHRHAAGPPAVHVARPQFPHPVESPAQRGLLPRRRVQSPRHLGLQPLRVPMQLESRRVYTGRVVRVDVDTVRFPDGSAGELEIIRHPGAAAIVPCASDPQGDPDPTILLIRQFRYAAGGPLWEIPAGTLDPGEDPEACARRELLEEAGVTAGRLQRLTSIWTTPGFTDEVIPLYLASGLPPGGPSRERDEFIAVGPHPLSQVLARIRDGEVRDAKTIVAILYMAGFVLKM